MEFSKVELEDMKRYLKKAHSQLEELMEVMLDIEVGGEVDHDGQPVMNSEELRNDLDRIDELIGRIDEIRKGV
jgi:hypothetical protein